jgi:hypothetical protein
MKKLRFVMAGLVVVFMMAITWVASAAPSYENPYDGVYKTEAKTLSTPDVGQVVYLFLDSRRKPVPGAVLVYNTTKGRDLQATADANGIIKLSAKNPEVFYVKQVIVGGKEYQVGGSFLVTEFNKQEIHKGLVHWMVLNRYNSLTYVAFKSC